MKTFRKAHEVDFWVWESDWGTERAATELEKFLHEIGTELKVLVPYNDPSCLRIKNHYDVFPYETIVYDNGHFYNLAGKTPNL